jgi:hypothetical protein
MIEGGATLAVKDVIAISIISIPMKFIAKPIK